MRGVMPDQLVCTKCWKWYDGRTLCPTCREPLVSPDPGKPLPELEAPPVATPVDASPAWRAGGEVPALAGEAFVEAPLPRMSGYPTGTPVSPPTRLQVKHYLVDDPVAGVAALGPLAARIAHTTPAPGGTPALLDRLAQPVTPPPAGPPPSTPTPDRRPSVSPLGPPFPPPAGTPSPGPGGAPPAATWAVRPPGSPAWPPSPVGPGGPPGGRVPLAPGPGPRSLGADAPTAPPGRTEALPLGWHPGVSLGRPLAAAPPSADPQASGFPLPMSRSLPTPPPPPPDAPSGSAALRAPDRPPAAPAAPPPAPAAPAAAPAAPAAAPAGPPPAPPAPVWSAVAALDAWPQRGPDAPAALARAPAAAAVAPVVPPPVGMPPASPPVAASWAPRAVSGPAPGAPEAVHPAASPERAEPLPPPPPPPAAAAPSPSGAAASTHETRLLPAVLVALVVSLAVAALWAAAAVQTDQVLPELAIVVGVASGLVIRRSARRGGFAAAVSAIVIALVAIAVGLALAALAVHSAGQGVTLETGLQTYTSSLLPQLRDEVGAAGVALGVAGVLVAGLLTLRRG